MTEDKLSQLTEIRTFTGQYINPVKAEKEQISIIDIAHALSRMPRFGGHTLRFYSVAQHSLRCADIVRNKPYELEVLLHDATEAYIMDMPKPVKNQMPEYRLIEKKLENTIINAFNLHSVSFYEEIKEVDIFALNEELEHLFNHPFEAPEEICNTYFEEKNFNDVEKQFLERYFELMEKRTSNGQN